MTVILYFLYLFALLILWRYVFWFPRSMPKITRERPLLMGHRGVRGEKPENTLEAFSYALESGLDGLEVDVQKLRDGSLILYHDDNLADGRLVTALTIKELSTSGEAFGYLDELLELVARYPDTLLNIEFKVETRLTKNLEKDVIKRVKAFNLEQQTLYSSFNPFSLLWARLFDPKARVAFLFMDHPEVPKLLRSYFIAGWLHVDALHPYEAQVDEKLVRFARLRGLNVNTWTVNDPMRISSLMALGVDAIIGDEPATLLQARK